MYSYLYYPYTTVLYCTVLLVAEFYEYLVATVQYSALDVAGGAIFTPLILP